MEIKPNNIYLGDAYELIKELPDKSVDIIYTDIPYLIRTGGGGQSPVAMRIQKTNYELGNKSSEHNLLMRLNKIEEQLLKEVDPSKHEKLRVQKNNIQNILNLKKANITNGIDYSILDEFVRVCRNIYIYMV